MALTITTGSTSVVGGMQMGEAASKLSSECECPIYCDPEKPLQMLFRNISKMFHASRNLEIARMTITVKTINDFVVLKIKNQSACNKM